MIETHHDHFKGYVKNRLSPKIWLVVCLFLLKLLKSREQLPTIKSAVTCHIIKIIGLAYIDDADLSQMNKNNEKRNKSKNVK